MTSQELKNSILQYAVQGRLAQQNPNDEPASELLKKIKAEKEQLIKEKVIKKEKPSLPIKDEEKPYEIPDNWEWVKIEQIAFVTKLAGFEYTEYIYPNLTNSGIPLFKGKNVQNGKLVLEFENFIPKEISDNLVRSKLTRKCLLTPYVGTIGNIAIFDGSFEAHLGSNVGKIEASNYLSHEFLYYFLKSTFGYKQLTKHLKATAQASISIAALRDVILPLPPLAEQQRIVEKIEELMPLVEQYGKAEAELKELNKAFPEKIKKSVMQYAIQGKLVPQNPLNEPASVLLEKIKAEKQKLIREKKIKADKPLPAIAEEEKPFEIPDGWAWIRLGDLTSKIGSGSTPTGGKAVYLSEGIKFIRSQNVYNDGLRLDNIAYISEKTNQAKKGSIVLPDDILLNITGASIGRCAIVPSDFDTANINQHVMIIRLIDKSIIEYLHFCLTSSYIQSKIMDVQVGVSREGLSATKLMEFLIPLPPLSEQKLIVKKVEELFGYCDKLK